MNVFTFGKYKGRLVTSILKENPKYFAWCKKNVSYFKFSIRDYEIYLTWSSVHDNNIASVFGDGYADDDASMENLFHKVELGEFDEYPDDKYLTNTTTKEYLINNKHYNNVRYIDKNQTAFGHK